MASNNYSFAEETDFFNIFMAEGRTLDPSQIIC